MEIGGRPSLEFVKFMKLVGSQTGVNLNFDSVEPRMHVLRLILSGGVGLFWHSRRRWFKKCFRYSRK